MLKFCDICQIVNTRNYVRVRESAIPVPCKVWSKIGIDLVGSLKEIDSYRYIGTTVNYTGEFVAEAEPLKDKTGEAVAKIAVHIAVLM